MISFQNSTVHLDGLSLLNQPIEGQSDFFNESNKGFTEIMTDVISHDDGTIYLEQLNQLRLPNDQISFLREQMEMGQTLPQAAEFVFNQLLENIKGLVKPSAEGEPASFSMDDATLADAEEISQELFALLPEPVIEQLKEELHQLLSSQDQSTDQNLDDVDELIAFNQEEPIEPESVGVPAQSLKTEDEHSPTLSGQDFLTKKEGVEQGEKSLQEEPIVDIEKQFDHVQIPFVRHSVKNTSSDHPKSVLIKDAPIQKVAHEAVVFHDAYGKLPSDTLENLSEKTINVLKPVMQNTAKNSFLAKVNPMVSPEQSSVNTVSVSSDSKSGFSGFGSNTTFTQLMTQATPQPITQNIHKPEWGAALGHRISWMLGKKLQSAQLRITPVHLGPVDIKLNLDKDAVHVSFVSNNQVVREALDQAIPRLKEMLNEENLELLHVDISDKHLAEKKQSTQNESEFSQVSSNNEPSQQMDENNDSGNEAMMTLSSRLLDAYA